MRHLSIRDILLTAVLIASFAIIAFPQGAEPDPVQLQAEANAYNKVWAEKNLQAKKKLVVAFEQSYPKSRRLPELYMDWSRNLVTQSDFTTAVQYAQKAVGAVAKIRAETPADDQKDPAWQKWIKGLETNAQSNLTWTKQMQAYQEQQFRANMIPKH